MTHQLQFVDTSSVESLNNAVEVDLHGDKILVDPKYLTQSWITFEIADAFNCRVTSLTESEKEPITSMKIIDMAVEYTNTFTVYDTAVDTFIKFCEDNMLPEFAIIAKMKLGGDFNE